MKHYFFDIHDGITAIDRVGLDLPDIEAARAHAHGKVARYAADPANLDEEGAIVVTVRSPADKVVINIRLVCHVEIVGDEDGEPVAGLKPPPPCEAALP